MNARPRCKELIPIALGIAVMAGLAACGSSASPPALLEKGVIWSVEWLDGKGDSHRMTRAYSPESVAGAGSGSWNRDLSGKLYATHLEIRDRQWKGSGIDVQIIPMDRIVTIYFGNGGRKKIEVERAIEIER